MSGQGIAQIVFYGVVLVALAYPLGIWMARVYGTWRGPRWLAAVERGFYRLVRTDPSKEQGWQSYAVSVLVFSVCFTLVLYAIQRLQHGLFLNPDNLPAVAPHIAINTTASFVTNTNWQYYGGEYTMSYLTQMAGLAVQNFVSAAVGMAALVAVVRGIARRSTQHARQFLARPLPVGRLHPPAALDHPRRGPDLAGRSPDVPRRTRRRRPSRARSRRSRAARRRRRSRSSSWARTAAASTTRTRPSRSRTRTGSRTSSRCSRSC